ncbi:MAG TPA: alpha/beta hydrolase [Chlamydiales bacterium]|nr:alpha/beta hydrolase [Chlamydiales bacterium]
MRTYQVSTSQGNISIWDSQAAGKPVLLIHGNNGCMEVFSHQFESDLAQKYRFIALDLPGHGNSDKAHTPQDTYNIEGYADVVMEVIKKMELVNPVVVGWSLGGHVGINLLQKSQKLAGLLITGAPPIDFSGDGFKEGFLPVPGFERLYSKIEFSKEDAVEMIHRIGGFDTEKAPFIVEAALKTDGYARHYLAQSLKTGIGGNQKEIVETNNTPLCVVQGKNEKGINNKYIIEKINYKNLFDHVYVVEGAGHAVFWEKPEAFNQILSTFLSKVFAN